MAKNLVSPPPTLVSVFSSAWRRWIELFFRNVEPGQGTWTPVLYGSSTAGSPTYDIQEGDYYVIGDLVWISCVVDISNKSTIAGNVRISGLPFKSHQNQGNQHTLSTASQLNGHNLTAPETPVAMVAANDTYVQLNYISASTGNAAVLVDTDITNSFIIRFAGVYRKA